MLTLRLEFLTGRYCASSPSNRNEAEWPPHPARIYSALVAAHYDGDAPAAGEAALKWLEAQPAPTIHFSPLSADGLEVRDVFDNYVPVNDKALSDAAQVDNAWAKVLSASTEKQRSSAEKRLASAYENVSSRHKKIPKEAGAQLAHVLPSTRTRQARTFPTVIPMDPTVWFSWDSAPPTEHVVALQALSRTLARVGHSSSLVAASWQADPPPSGRTLVPLADGRQTLRWVGAGQFDALQAMHVREPFGEQRVMPYVAARYDYAGERGTPRESSFSDQLLVFRRTEGRRVDVGSVEFLTEALRGALLHHADDPVANVISGHYDGAVVQTDHLAILGLANVGQPHANGNVLGLAISLPRSATPKDLAAIYSAIAHWEASGCSLKLGRLGSWTLEREGTRTRLRTLRPNTWTRSSTRWVSVTPVILDRHPGSLHSGPPEKQRKAHAKARASIGSACERIGLPAPVAIELTTQSLLRGAPNARQFRSPTNRRDHRPRVHATLIFEQPVAGPVILGAGRYRGLGLFRPCDSQKDGQA